MKKSQNNKTKHINKTKNKMYVNIEQNHSQINFEDIVLPLQIANRALECFNIHSTFTNTHTTREHP